MGRSISDLIRFGDYAGTLDLRYVDELALGAYGYLAITVLELYRGIERNFGVLEKAFWELPKKYLKLVARFGKPDRFDFNKFKILKRDGKPLGDREWAELEEAMRRYLRQHTDKFIDDMTIKAILLAFATNEMELQRDRDRKQRSLGEVENKFFDGVLPSGYSEAEKRYALNDRVRDYYMRYLPRVGMYIQGASRGVIDSVKRVIQNTYINRQDELKENYSQAVQKVKSDLYWAGEDFPELKKYAAETRLRDLYRIAHTEIAFLHENAKLMSYDTSKPVYFVFNGRAVCEVCQGFLGKIVRLIDRPARTDNLKALGIEDPYADYAVWAGKNNVDRPKAQWWICAPVHPFCGDHLDRIDPAREKFDLKHKRIVRKEAGRYIAPVALKRLETLRAERLRLEARQRRQKFEAAYGVVIG